MKISVIIPTLNEEEFLPKLLSRICNGSDEVLVADGGSSDRTLEVANRFSVRILQAARGRARQMNAAAQQAQGEILWFLHADSDPPPNWREEILKTLSDLAVGSGAFRSRIDAPGIRYRLLDLWGGLRASWTGTFYGDQGLFVRRELFERLGGFPDWPCLEDLDFSVQLKREGKVRLLAGPLKTSARRWQTDGFWRTVFYHTRLALGYSLKTGTQYPRLSAKPQTGKRANGPTRQQNFVLILMAKAPVPGQVKTRLVPPLSPEQAAEVASRLLGETATLVCQLKGEVEPIVAVTPREGIEQIRQIIGDGFQFIPQPQGDLGARLSTLSEQFLSAGAQGVLILGTDHPGLPLDSLRKAVKILESEEDPVVLGPTEDGGYYLVGLKKPHPELFRGIPWSTSEVLKTTQARAREAGLKVKLVPPWFDLDRPEDLKRWQVENRKSPIGR